MEKTSMASNFGIAVKKNHDRIAMKLTGDFDATSACELSRAIKELFDSDATVTIYTDDIKVLHPFGLEVFQRILNPKAARPTRVVFVGKNASELLPKHAGLI